METQMQCRFCLETDNKPMISPCRCSGTVKYVHKECIHKWVFQDDQIIEERNNCSICKDTIFKFEFVPLHTEINNVILSNATAINMLIQYLYVVFILTPNDSLNVMYVSHALMQFLYITIYIDNFRVKNLQLYHTLACERYGYTLYIFYILSLIAVFKYEHLVCSIMNNMIITVQWKEHLHTLSRVNECLIAECD